MVAIITQDKEGIHSISRLDDLGKENLVRIYSNKEINTNLAKAMLLVDFYKNKGNAPQPNEIENMTQKCDNYLRETKAIRYYNPFDKAFWKHTPIKAFFYGISGIASIYDWKMGVATAGFASIAIETNRRKERLNIKKEKELLNNLKNLGIEYYRLTEQ